MRSLITHAIKALIASNQINYEYNITKDINRFLREESGDDDESNCMQGDANEAIDFDVKSLPIDIRQQVINHVIRERKTVDLKLVCRLIENGIWSLDLWQLSDILRLGPLQVRTILRKLRSSADSLANLRVGGSTWIFDQTMITNEGLLVELFGSKKNCDSFLKRRRWDKLTQLTVQQFSSVEEFLAVCESCPKLRSLEICQPCLTDYDLNANLMSLLALDERYASIRHSLQRLCVPSSFNGKAIAKLLTLFPNVKSLKCARFEQLMDLVSELLLDNREDKDEAISGAIDAKKVQQTLGAMESLTITHPMSWDSVGHLVRLCPSLKHLALEIQDYMIMWPLVELQHLTSLEVHNSPTTPASFHQQLLPVLKMIGDRLNSVSLEQFDVVDLVTLAKLCPNLTRFSAQWFTILGHANHNERTGRYTVKRPFPQLKYLRLRPRAQRMIPSPAVHFLLGHAEQLEHIELYCCHEFGDSDVKTLFLPKDPNLNLLHNDSNIQSPSQLTPNPNPVRSISPMDTQHSQVKGDIKLAHLKCFIMRHGHGLTKEGIGTIISHAPHLEYIDCGRPPLKKGQNLDDD